MADKMIATVWGGRGSCVTRQGTLAEGVAVAIDHTHVGIKAEALGLPNGETRIDIRMVGSGRSSWPETKPVGSVQLDADGRPAFTLDNYEGNTALILSAPEARAIRAAIEIARQGAPADYAADLDSAHRKVLVALNDGPSETAESAASATDAA